MSDQQIDGLRAVLSALLPKAIARAVNSYEAFATQAPPDNAKEFSAHHSACKSALAHLDYLTKLAKWVEAQKAKNGTSADDDEESLEPLIVTARTTLVEYDTIKGDQ